MCIKGFTSAELLDHPRAPDDAAAARARRAARGRSAGTRRSTSSPSGCSAHPRRARRRRRSAAFGSGALTNEKAYLLGKFARVALRTPNIDYNGRYCMSSAAAGQNRAFGIDRGLPLPGLGHRRDADAAALGLELRRHDAADHAVDLRAAGAAAASSIVVDPRRTDDRARRRRSTCSSRPAPISRSPTASSTSRSRRGSSTSAYIAARTEGFDAAAAQRARVPTRRTSSGSTGVPIEEQLPRRVAPARRRPRAR